MKLNIIAILASSCAVLLLQLLSTGNAVANQGDASSQCASVEESGTISTLPMNVINRTSLAPAAKTAVSQLPLCLVKGELIYVRPTMVVHYFIRQKNGIIRSRAVMVGLPASTAKDGDDLAITYANGNIRRFPKASVISSTTADDYEIYIVGKGLPVPAGLSAIQPDYIVK